VIGARVDGEVLTGVAGHALDEIEECIESGLLQSDGDLLMFRHQLGCDAIYDAILPLRRRQLHAQVLAVMRELPNRDERLAALSHHAELAQDHEATLEFAIAAAEQARQLRAHREAAGQYARALRFAGSLPLVERASLLEAWSYECYLTNRMTDAIEGREAALEVWRELANPVKEGENLRWLSRVLWFAGRNADAEDAAQAALAILEPLPPGPQLAWAYSNLAQLRVLAYDNEGAIAWGERAIALAERLGEREILIHALNNVGMARARTGEPQGERTMERSLALALEAGFAEHAARAWSGLASASAMQLQLGRARQFVTDGIAYAAEHDEDSLRLYLTSWRAMYHLFLGDWLQAERDCDTVLRQPRAATVSRIVALTALGRLRARRGDPDAMAPLDEALALAQPTGELQRLGPVYVARAEAAWLAGDAVVVAATTRALLGMTSLRLHPWLCGEIAWWLRQGGETALPDGELAEPYALQVAGDWAAAASAWDRLGCPYEAASARLASDDAAALRSALATFEHLGAEPALARTLKRLRDIGAPARLRGPSRSTRAHPAGLTAREAEILSLIAAGETNREIAARLYLSPKTVEHHVTAILGKLGVPTRQAAARVAADIGGTRAIRRRQA
jgi:DNA-binding CsgD family transcriptional regulator/tetratricopeptide (TPR) repeat protein